ncbi:gamma-glutamyl-gamma-aminobutyrate hydrolase family protein [Aestuariirhabdus litorea]|uniref:Gamma-glutamyl-gamma-aminobutyrate hydrolase family protein n=1 Tax=Aestuariirhabdus litorea TaxID=2528527 RepID=A0A3P3VLK6_9GAMM|nr:type 1 glutamine amidotransferase [Aestuariirhabdus litorea]RRJ83510.1 gamma-glutamyl-gamma-aminobutyrate hydrolase family protein [Aestuariirhabdus litorea]RWW93008.1 gamma-glutamyl-gamma-aminobutyrate hydrolase family protein [Endozoicomonadaceae bacterium GTF-13]
MARRPRIGVTGNARRWAPGWWCSWLVLLWVGARPLRISVKHNVHIEELDGLVIGGGSDIAPEHYGGDLNRQVRADPARDELEIAWIQRGLSHNLPILGICRGAQLLNVVLGGNLYGDIRELRRRTHNRPGLMPTKRVELASGSRLQELVERQRLRVNSLHHQAIRDLGEGLRVVARDRDDFVQAVEAEDGRPLLGVQWHPEYLAYLPAQRALFRWLVENADRD